MHGPWPRIPFLEVHFKKIRNMRRLTHKYIQWIIYKRGNFERNTNVLKWENDYINFYILWCDNYVNNFQLHGEMIIMQSLKMQDRKKWIYNITIPNTHKNIYQSSVMSG